MSARELRALLASPAAIDDVAASGTTVVVVEGDLSGDAFAIPPLLPAVVVADCSLDDRPAVASCDLAASAPALDAVLDTVDEWPIASASLTTLLRRPAGASVSERLLAESAVYGVLQGGSEFARWRAARDVRARKGTGAPPVEAERVGDTLRITLRRPEVRNALDAAMRDALAGYLHVALAEGALRVELAGDGPAFCSGGDLDEFGSRADPAVAHLVRLARSLGQALHDLSPRTQVFVHGPCRGSGVELPAFAGTVIADPGATFALPEVAMGLIPGAGGTVSLPGRIGRQRTAWLALTRQAVDAQTALEWGLVDELRPREHWPTLR